MRALPRQSCFWGVVLFIIGCGTDSGEPGEPGQSGAGPEGRGGLAAGGSPRTTGGATNEGGKASTAQNTGAGGNVNGATGPGGSADKGGSQASGGHSKGKGGSAGGATAGRGGEGGAAKDGGLDAAKDDGSRGARGGRFGTDGGSPGAGGKDVGNGGSSHQAGGSVNTAGGSATGGKADGGAAEGGAIGELTCSGPVLTGGKQHCSSNTSGDLTDGYSFQIWSSGSGGCITTYGVGAAFKATWNNSGDFLARAGLGWDETKTHDQLGTIAAEYAYKKTGNGGGYSYIGIYGWSNDPLIEYYIVDDWLGSRYVSGTRKGSLTIDGGTYDIYTNTRTNQPSIHGNATFQQYFSFRTTARQCGHISISEHFKKWESLGMKLGKMYEARILVEAGGGSGSVDFTYATVTAN